jgi:hypothetical protein
VHARVTAAVVAVLAVLAWVGPPALAATPALAGTHRPGTRGPGTHGSGSTPAPHLSGINQTAVIVGAIVLALALAIFLTRRLSRRSAGGAGTGPDRGSLPGPPAAELTAQASRALVETDDAVRTSEQELGFATATFGEHAVAPFSAALQAARAELTAAFKLRQSLDDDIPKSEATRRSYLADVSSHCAAANRLLDEQAEAFDGLQDLQARAPQLVAEVDAHVVQQSARISRSRQVLEQLAAKYTPDAVVAVGSNPDQAAERLEFAASSLASARRELADGQSGEAAVLLQAAESGADQATDLLNGVEHMEAELTQAASALPGGLREVDAEIAEAAALLAEQPPDERSSLVAGAQAVAADVRTQQAAGPFDALAALRHVQQADAALDRALAGARADQDRRERARAVLDQAMLVARSSATAAEDFITTRRGGVGVNARTRLAEAQRHFQQAIGCAQPDPEAALGEAQQADALAQQARALAEQDVAGFGHGQAARPSRVGGPGGLDGLGRVSGLGSAILGGVLITSPLSGQIGPGSFGGVGTRDRHSVAARS